MRSRFDVPPGVAAAAGGESRLRAVLQAGRAHAPIGHPCGSNNWKPPEGTTTFDKYLRNLDNGSKMNENGADALGELALLVKGEYDDLKTEKQDANWFKNAVGPSWLEHRWVKFLRDIKERADKEEERFAKVMKILKELMDMV